MAALVVTAFPNRAQAQSQVTGQWITLPNNLPHFQYNNDYLLCSHPPGTQPPARQSPAVHTQSLNPAHSALMKNGQLLLTPGQGYNQNLDNQAGVVNPTTGTSSVLGAAQGVSWNMFCDGMVVLPDGEPFVVSGELPNPPFPSNAGSTSTATFNPDAQTFTGQPALQDGRWYPTLTALGDGRVMAFSGCPLSGCPPNANNSVEIYSMGPPFNKSAQFSNSGWPTQPPTYPRLHLLPDGRVFYSGTSGAGTGGPLPSTTMFFDPSNPSGGWSTGPTTLSNNSRDYGTSVLLPLTIANNYKPRVMIFGGGPGSPGYCDNKNPSQRAQPSQASTEIFDLSTSPPGQQFSASMSTPRIQLNAVILPSGNVLIVGGSGVDDCPDSNFASRNADLFDLSRVNQNADPQCCTVAVRPAGFEPHDRLYHSVALLLPDGTVWASGGNECPPNFEFTMDVYQPAYLFDSNGNPAVRPTISQAPSTVAYNAMFQVQTPNDANNNITSAVLIRAGAVTHAFNMEQRMVELAFTGGSTGTLTVTGPANGNIAPPGYYMLFLLNSNGVPSVASWVQVGNVGVSISGSGTVTSDPSTPPPGIQSAMNCTSSCAAYYSPGATVFLNASPADSYAFDPNTAPGTGWVSGCDSVSGSQCTVSVPANITHALATAVFGPQLTVSIAGSGTGSVTSNPAAISCPSTCVANFGGTVTLSANAGAGSFFAGWGGACSGTSLTCTVTMNGPQNATATFSPNTLTLSIAGLGSVRENGAFNGAPVTFTCSSPTGCQNVFDANTNVTLTPLQPGAGYYFKNWLGCDSVSGSVCTMNMTQPKSVTADFEPNVLTANFSGPGSGFVNVNGNFGGAARYASCAASGCQTSFDAGATVALAARGNPGNAFTGWTTMWPGSSCSGTATPCSGVLNSPQTVTASFAPASITATAPTIGQVFTAGTQLTISWSNSSSVANDTFRIDLLRGGGSSSQITSAVAASVGVYNWPIPSNQALSQDYQVLITDLNNPVWATSASFKILSIAPAAIALTSVNSGIVTRSHDKTISITWIYTGSAGPNVTLQLYKEGALLPVTITGPGCTSIGSGAVGACSWTPAADLQIGSGYSVKITESSSSQATDRSHAFVIVR